MARRPGWLPCVALAVAASTCGKRGDPLPPLRRVPTAVTDLAVSQRGDRMVVTLVAPRTTTEGQRLPVLDLELLRADTDGDFAKVARAQRLKAAPGESLTRQEPLPAAGTTVRFAARASAWGHPSPLTSVVTLTVQAIPPPPAGLTARMAGAAVALQWPAPVASPAALAASAYWPYRRAKDGAYLRPLTPQPLAGSTHEDADGGGRLGETWCYVVRAVASTEPLVESPNSPEACLTVADVVPPAAPAGVAAVVRDGTVEVSWSPSFEPDLAHYRVYRGPLGGDAREKLAELGPGDSTYRDSTATARPGYVYRVTAVDRAGNESPPSAPAEARLP